MPFDIRLIPILAITLCVAVGVPAIAGVYVYNDAKQRNMDPLVWTLIAVLIPGGIIGIIIYLVGRDDNYTLRCYACKTAVEERTVTCPGCGAKLRYTCPECGKIVERTWKLCPDCGAVTDRLQDVTPTVRRKEKCRLLRVLSIVVGTVAAVSVIALLVMLAIDIYYPPQETITVEAVREEYLQENPEVHQWLESVKTIDGGICALYWYEDKGRVQETHYIVVSPSMLDDDFLNAGVQTPEAEIGLGQAVKVYLDSGEDYGVIHVTYTGKERAELIVYLDGRRQDCREEPYMEKMFDLELEVI